MEQRLHELFEQGYSFFYSDYWGDDLLESWEEIVEDYHSDDGDEWCYVRVIVDDEAREVCLFHENDE